MSAPPDEPEPSDPLPPRPRLVPADLETARVDRAVSELFDLPVASARRLLEAGRVRIDGLRRKKGETVRVGQAIELTGEGRWLVPLADARLAVLLVEPELVVVDKPPGMPCHPLVPGEGGTVVDALAALYPEIEQASPAAPREAGLAHRLDNGTSGCLVVARTPAAWRGLRAQFAAENPAGPGGPGVEKRYVALVHGLVPAGLTIAEPIGHDPQDARRMRIDARGRAASSVLVVLASGPNASLVELLLQGGRRHQLRVHLAHVGHPIVGDLLYGAPEAADTAHALLHARSLLLPGRAPIEAPLPQALVQAARSRGLAVR